MLLQTNLRGNFLLPTRVVLPQGKPSKFKSSGGAPGPMMETGCSGIVGGRATSALVPGSPVPAMQEPILRRIVCPSAPLPEGATI